MFVHWLYTGKVPYINDDCNDWDNMTEPIRDIDIYEQFLIGLKAYVFGDRFLSDAFRCAVNAMLARAIEEDFYVKADRNHLAIVFAFVNIPAERPILQCFVDDFCQYWTESSDTEGEAEALRDLPPAFMACVARRLAVMAKCTKGSFSSSMRCYTEHASEEEKSKCVGRLHMNYHEKREFGYFE